MGTVIDFANNPFFIHDLHKLCAVCNKRLEKEKYSIFSGLPKQHSRVTVLDVLRCISDYNSTVGPQHVCPTCYHNTFAAYKFRILCNGSHEKLTNYLNHQRKMTRKHDKRMCPVKVVKMHVDDNKTSDSKQEVNHEHVANPEDESEQLEHTEQDVAVQAILYDSSELVVSNEAEVETQEEIPDQANGKECVGDDHDDDDDNDNMSCVVVKHENILDPAKDDYANDNVTTVLSRRTICKVCHKEYRADYIAVHMRIHTGERPYRCRTCNKGFSTSTILKLHKASHSEDRQYICRFCGNGYKLLRTLQVHERGHTGEKPFKCNACEKSFTSASRRKQHQLVHTGEKQFTCELCAKSFTRMTILKDHLKSHAGVKDYACHLCGNRFTQAHSLRSHLERSCRAKKMTDPVETVEVYKLESDEEGLTEEVETC